MSQFRNAVRERALPLASSIDLEPLLARASRTRLVLLGEASYGTREFYEWRRIITSELIERHGFRFVAIEADWPLSMTLHRLISSENDRNACDALQSFSRWPSWLWANQETLRLVESLNRSNQSRFAGEKVGLFGLDVYSLYESIEEILRCLSETHPLLARQARARYERLEPYARDGTAGARSAFYAESGCEDLVVNKLLEQLEFRLRDDIDGVLGGGQHLVREAEGYYRSLVTGDDFWNRRSHHMLDTLTLLSERYGPGIVWAHNTHVGDHRATDMAREGLLSLGGLARQKWGNEAVCLVGFGTYRGTVIASTAWEGPTLELNVPSALPGSLEAAMHEAVQASGNENLLYVFNEKDSMGPLFEPHGHRAMGVVYASVYEPWRQYVPTSLARRYDAFVFVDRTSALKPLRTVFRRDEISEAWSARY